MPELRDWLRDFGLEPLAAVLAENDVDLDILPELTDGDLEKLGLSLGYRRKLLRAAATLADTPTRSVDAPPAPAGEAAPAPEAARRQVTVLFSDLVGSTALSTALDPEEMSGLIRRYQDACAGAVARFDGYIAKFMGDGVLAYFGYPQAREDAAERAVRAALAVVEAVRQIAQPNGAALETRVGIATGLVVVGDIVGSGAAREEAIVGETPNLAARLQSLAEPDSVLVSEATYRLLGRTFEYEDRGQQTFKGFAKPVPVWRVLREAPVASRFAAARGGFGPFVGRAQEIGLLVDRWRLAQHGEGQAVAAGRSALRAHRRRAAPPRRDAMLAILQQYGVLPVDAANRACRRLRAGGFHKAETRQARCLARDDGHARRSTAPLLADLLSLPADGRYAPVDLTPAQRKNATLSVLVDQLIRLSEREPLLFVLEDAHWIDPTTLELLTRFIDAISEARAFVIVTARPEFASPWIGRDHVGSLALSKLSKTQCAEIVAGIAATQLMTVELVEEILAKTDGVPLYVEEMTRAIAESPTADRLAVPATLQDSLMARLDRLGPAKEIAQIAATIGRQFAQALLAAVAPVDAGELDAALLRLTEARLVFPHARAIEPTYSFKHALTRDVAYDSLLRARRLRLHERIARTLQERFPALAEAEPEILAHHFSLAGLPAPACLYSERAGDRALSRAAYKEAIAHFSAGLQSAEALVDSQERMRRQLDLLLKLGPTVMVVQGMQSVQALEDYRRAAELAQTLGHPTALYKAKWGLWLNANLGRRTAEALERARELVVLAQQSGDDDLLLEAYHCKWSTAFFRGDVAECLQNSRTGVKTYDMARHRHLGQAFGGHDPGVCAHCVSAMMLNMTGERQEADELFARALEIAEALDHPSSLTFALYERGLGYQIAGDREGAATFGRRAAETSERLGLVSWRAGSLLVAAWAGANGGDIADAMKTVEGEVDLAVSAGPVPLFNFGLAAEVMLIGGRPAEGLAYLDRAVASGDEPDVGFYLPEIHRLRGLCLLALDRSAKEQARAAFRSARNIAQRQGAILFRDRAEAALADL